MNNWPSMFDENMRLQTRVHVLEQQNANYYKSYQLYMERALDAESRNAKLVEALEFYADKENYFLWLNGGSSITVIDDDEGKIAAAALKEMEVRGE